MKSTIIRMERTPDVTITVNVEDCVTVRLRGSKSLAYPTASVNVVLDLVTLRRELEALFCLVL